MATGVGLTQISANPEKPLFGSRTSMISHTQAEFKPIFDKITNFCYHGNKGGSSKN